MKKAFTLVELIVVITILVILWAISFISLSWYSKEARDAKRDTDVSSLLSKMNIENARWTQYIDMLEETETYELLINWDLKESTIWVLNFELLKENRENFLDPTTKQDYIFATAKWESDWETYNFIQWKYLSEKENIEVIKWNYYKFQEKDAPNLFVWDYIEPETNYVWNYTDFWVCSKTNPNILNEWNNDCTASCWWWIETRNCTEAEWIKTREITCVNTNTNEIVSNDLCDEKSKEWLTIECKTELCWKEWYETTRECNAQACAVNAECWSANNLASYAQPTQNLCSNWVIPAITWTWPWTWQCEWEHWWSPKDCQAPLKVDWTCWSSNWLAFKITPTDNLCTTWVLSSVVNINWWYQWICDWKNWWLSATCTAVYQPKDWLPLTNYKFADTTYPWCDTRDLLFWEYVFASCNLWTNIAWVTSASYGSFYQWWRNTTTWTQTKAWTEWDWISPHDDDLWWWVSNNLSKMRWPCANWYHVPTYNEMKWFLNYWNWTLWTLSPTKAAQITNFSKATLMPLTWHKIVDTWAVGYKTIIWNYWLSTTEPFNSPDNVNKYIRSYSLDFRTYNSNYRIGIFGARRWYGFSVRCIRD